MMFILRLAFAAICLLAGQAAAAQEQSIVGTWAATDPETGRQEQLVITDGHLQFDPDQPPVPYSSTQSGNLFILEVGNGQMPPLRMTLNGDETATLTLPGSAPITLTRVATAPQATPEAPQAGAAPPANAFDETLSAFVPFGVTTRFEPLNQSLEQLLGDGWRLDQATGAGGSFTLLISKGDMQALCVLVPHSMGQAPTALSDCRRLN